MKNIVILFCTLFAIFPLMGNDISWSFPPDTLSTGGVNASTPKTVIDSSGNAVAVWVESGLVKAKTKPVAGSWSSAVTLSGSSASVPSLASAPNGTVAAVWVEGGIVKAATKTLVGSWTSATSLSTAGGSAPTVAASAVGDFVAAWVKGSNIESSTKLAAGSWQTRVAITSSSAGVPHVAVGGSGSSTRAVIVWHGVSSGANVVFSSSKLLSGSWTAQTVISDNAHSSQFARVAMDSNANAVAIWYQYDLVGSLYSDVVVQSASMLAGGSWTPSVAISAPGVRNPSGLSARVSFDGNGNAMALWATSFDGENFSIQSAVAPVRQNWTAPTDIITSLYSSQASLAVSALGDALSTYLFYNGASLQIQSSESDISGFTGTTNWSVPINVSSGSQNGFPCVAVSVTGNTIYAVATWMNFNGSNQVVEASTGTRAILAPPSSLSVTQAATNLGVFSEYTNTLSWTASTDPNVIGYLIYRNGMFIEQVDAGTTQINDHNMVQNGAVTYGVSAVDNQQSHSRIINVNFP